MQPFCNLNNHNRYDTVAKYGFYLDGKIEEADCDGEWMYFENETLYFYYTGNLEQIQITLGVLSYGIYISSSVSNVEIFLYTLLILLKTSISGISFTHQLEAAVKCAWDNSFSTVSDCTIMDQALFGVVLSGISSICTHNSILRG